MHKKIGGYAFLFGLVLLLILSFVPALLGTWGAILLVVLGIVVGYMNIKDNESIALLIAVLALPTAAAALNTLPGISSLLGPILLNLVAFGGGIAIPVALMTFWKKAKN